jgi:hypothetical protein
MRKVAFEPGCPESTQDASSVPKQSSEGAKECRHAVSVPGMVSVKGLPANRSCGGRKEIPYSDTIRQKRWYREYSPFWIFTIRKGVFV